MSLFRLIPFPSFLSPFLQGAPKRLCVCVILFHFFNVYLIISLCFKTGSKSTFPLSHYTSPLYLIVRFCFCCLVFFCLHFNVFIPLPVDTSSFAFEHTHNRINNHGSGKSWEIFSFFSRTRLFLIVCVFGLFECDQFDQRAIWVHLFVLSYEWKKVVQRICLHRYGWGQDRPFTSHFLHTQTGKLQTNEKTRISKFFAFIKNRKWKIIFLSFLFSKNANK